MNPGSFPRITFTKTCFGCPNVVKMFAATFSEPKSDRINRLAADFEKPNAFIFEVILESKSLVCLQSLEKRTFVKRIVGSWLYEAEEGYQD